MALVRLREKIDHALAVDFAVAAVAAGVENTFTTVTMGVRRLLLCLVGGVPRDDRIDTYNESGEQYIAPPTVARRDRLAAVRVIVDPL